MGLRGPGFELRASVRGGGGRVDRMHKDREPLPEGGAGAYELWQLLRRQGGADEHERRVAAAGDPQGGEGACHGSPPTVGQTRQ